ncbi:MAG: hypothetical protein J6K14_05785 [Clostridia bacterium]|nr:hypothetical protein [Clostridia bacterium]
MRNKKRKIETASGHMLYWWGNKFIKRLASKRARKAAEKEMKEQAERDDAPQKT